MSDRDRDTERLRALAEATEAIEPSAELALAVMEALPDDVDERLARAAAATADLDADPALGDAVMAELDPIDGVLVRAARATADLAPEGDLAAAVLRVVRPGPARHAWPHAVVRSARAALVAASLAAAASVILSLYTQSELDADVMSAVDTVEDAE